MTLRPYQERAVSETREALRTNRSVCLVMQVGAGKTVVACDVIRRALERGRKCLFVVHRVELVEQAHARLSRFGIQAGIIKAGYQEHRDRPVQVACVPTLIRRAFPPSDLTILDECHHAVSDSWLKVAKHYREVGHLVGITATPLRLDGRGLGSVFDTLLEPVKTAEMIAGGFLIEPIVYAPPESCNRRGLKMRGGDFALPELAERMQTLTGSITEYWSKFGRGRRSLIFAVNVDHSRRIEEALREVGARVTHVDGTSAKQDRVQANRMLRDGKLDAVTQCNLWTEGVDIPEIDCIIVARPTASLSLHRQMIGRGMRPAPGKANTIVLDHAGNAHVHGLITQEIDWSLDAPEKRTVTGPAVRTCKECFACIGPGAVVCPACGAPIPVRDEAEPPGVENAGFLTEFVVPPPKPTKDEKEDAYREWVRTASLAKYTVGWARFRYKERYGVWPRLRAVEAECYSCRGHKYTLKQYSAWKSVYRCEWCYDEQRADSARAL